MTLLAGLKLVFIILFILGVLSVAIQKSHENEAKYPSGIDVEMARKLSIRWEKIQYLIFILCGILMFFASGIHESTTINDLLSIRLGKIMSASLAFLAVYFLIYIICFSLKLYLTKKSTS